MSGWEAFATVAGGTSGVLLGLLFVAVSVRLDAIRQSRELSSVTVSAVMLFSFGVVVAILLAIPGQSVRLLGGEVAALAVMPWLNPWLRAVTRKLRLTLAEKPADAPADAKRTAVNSDMADVEAFLLRRNDAAPGAAAFKVPAGWVGPTLLTAANFMLAQVVAAALLIFDVRGALYVLAAIMVLSVFFGVRVAWWSMAGNADRRS